MAFFETKQQQSLALDTVAQNKEMEMENNDLMLDVKQAYEIKRAARKAGFTAKDLKQLSSAEVMRMILPFIQGYAEIVMQDTFSVVIDRSKSFISQVQAGHYDWVNPNITADEFPINGEGKVRRNLHLVHFDKDMTNSEVLKELEAQNLEPAQVEDLLFVGAAYPALQQQFSIACLGTVLKSGSSAEVLYLTGGDQHRYLWLSNYEGVGSKDDRYLARSKKL